MKKVLSLSIALLMLLISLTGCGATAKPEATVKGLMEATKQLDFAVMDKYLGTDLSDSSQEEMEEIDYFIDMAKEYLQKMEYEVLEATVDGDIAQVPVKVKYVDASTLIGEIFTEVLQQAVVQAFSATEMSEEKMNQMMIDIFEEKKDKVAENFAEATIIFECTKTDGVWNITEFDETKYIDVITANTASSFEKLEEALG